MPDRSSLIVSAPGKMMISGEYAVLHGAEALVAAVDRRAYARFRGPADPEPAPEARAAFRQALPAADSGEAEPTVDTSRMYQGGIKLGLGSSAAAAAAAAGLALAADGVDIAAGSGRARVLDAALRGHRAAAPQGSGADVAASVLGGFVRFRKLGDRVETHPIAWPADLRASVVWTGEAARTSDYLSLVDALAQRAPGEHRDRMRALGEEADRFVSAVLAGDTSEVIASTAAYGAAMAALGKAAGAGIVNERLARVAELARDVGGASKPSGAGGGDVALALLPDEASEQRFQRMCSDHNFTVILIQMGAAGVRVEASYPGEAI